MDCEDPTGGCGERRSRAPCDPNRRRGPPQLPQRHSDRIAGQSHTEVTLELSRFVGIVVRWSWLILTCAVIGGASAYAISAVVPKQYTASSIVLVGSLTETDLQQQLAFQQLARTYATLANTRPVVSSMTRTARLLDTDADPQDRVSARAVEGETIVEASGTSGDPQRAALLAEAIADDLVALSTAGPDGAPLVAVIKRPELPTAPSSPTTTLNVVVGVVLGGAVGLAVAVAADGWRQRRRMAVWPGSPVPPW